MSRYRIVCTEQEPVNEPTTHAHVVAVGTGIVPSQVDKRWTIDEILAAMGDGDAFYTQGETSGKIASVEKYVCSSCYRTWIRSTADAASDNNLDSLRRCS
jgi:hypothetical protein